jgi:hypothetical protein
MVAGSKECRVLASVMDSANQLRGVEPPCHAHHNAHWYWQPGQSIKPGNTRATAMAGMATQASEGIKRSFLELVGPHRGVLPCFHPQGPLTMTADDVLAVHDSLLLREHAGSKLPANPSELSTCRFQCFCKA